MIQMSVQFCKCCLKPFELCRNTVFSIGQGVPMEDVTIERDVPELEEVPRVADLSAADKFG